MNKSGKLIIYAGPSGSGKGTIKNMVLKNNDFNIVFSVSATTRKPREGEKNGKDYFFIDQKEFKKLIKEKKFIEWTKYSGNYYGTLESEVLKSTNKGKNVLLEVEIEGVKNILKRFPESVTIFIMPPSIEELEKRLISRNTEKKSEIRKRLKIAKKEIKHSTHFKHIIVNKEIKESVKQLSDILKKELKE